MNSLLNRTFSGHSAPSLVIAMVLLLLSALPVSALPPFQTGAFPALDFPEDDVLATGRVDGFFDDPEGDQLSFSSHSITPADRVTVAHSGPRGRNLTIMGEPDQFGPYSFVLTVADNGGDFIEVVVNGEVMPEPDAPEVFAPLGTSTLVEDSGAAPTIDLYQHFRDVDLEPLTFSIDSQTNAPVLSVSLVGSDLQLSTVPDAFGSNTIRICANDGVFAPECDDLEATVSPVNDPTTLIGSLGTLSANEDQPGTLAVDLTPVFEDVDSTINYSLAVTPSGIINTAIVGNQLRLSTVSNASGTVSVVVTAGDGVGPDVFDTLIVNVAPVPDPPTLDVALTDVTIGEDSGASTAVDLNTHFSDVDGDILSYSIDSESNPAAVNVSISANFLQIETTANAFGNNSVSVCATDGVTPALCDDLLIRVTPVNDLPVLIGSLGAISTPEDTPGTLAIDLSAVFEDVDDALNYTLLPTPAGIVNASTVGDELRLTLEPDANGTVTVLVTAADSSFSTVEDTLTINVVPVADAPVVDTALGAKTFGEDQTSIPGIELNDHFSDADGDTLTYTLVQTPGGVINATIGGSTLSFSTILDVSGSTNIEVTATDGSGANVSSVLVVTVDPVNDAPVKIGSAGTITMDEDQITPLPTFDLSTIYTDVDSGSLTFTIVSLNPGGVVNASIAAGTSILTFSTIQDVFGTTDVAIAVTDGFAAGPPEIVTVVVNPTNDAPVADTPLSPVTLVEDSGSAVTVSLASAFVDVDGDTLSYSVVSVTPAGKIGTSITGSTLQLTTVLNEFGSATIVIEAIDGGSVPASTTLTVNVTEVQDAPLVVAPIADKAFPEDPTPAELPPFQNLNDVFVDPDGDALTFSVINIAPVGVVLSDVNGEELRVLSIPHANGFVTITVEAQDANGNSETDEFTVDVASVPDVPTVIEPSPVEVDEDGATPTVDATAWFDDFDFPNDNHGYSVVGISGDPVLVGGSVTITAGGSLEYELVLNSSGTAQIDVMVTDQDGLTATTTLTVNVNPVNDPPFEVAPLPTQTALEDEGSPTFSLAGVFDDPDVSFPDHSLTYSVTAGASSALGTFSTSGDNLVLSQLVNENGTATVEVTVTDNANETATTLVTVTIAPVNDAPFANAISPGIIQIDEDASVTGVPLAGLATYFDDVDLSREGDSFAFALVGGDTSPLFDSISLSGDQLLVDPAANAVGFHDVQVIAIDQAGTGLSSPPLTIQLEVLLVIAIAVDDTFTISESNENVAPDPSQLIDVLANDTPGDDPTVIIAAGISVDLGDSGLFEGVSETEPTSIPNSSGVDIIEPNGRVDIENNGTMIRYVPKPNYSGTDFFTYTIQDADGDVSSATVTVTITADNDAPESSVSPVFDMQQAGVLTVLAEGGLLNMAYDPEGHQLEVQGLTVTDPAAGTVELGSFDEGGVLIANSEGLGGFVFTPLPSFTGEASFLIRYSEVGNSPNLVSPDVVVTINVAPTPPPPAAPPADEVEFDMNLSDVPLEDAISTEANVLVVMDDSGSMDWDMMTDQSSGVFNLSNGGNLRDNGISGRNTWYYYIYDLPTHVYSYYTAPVQAAIDADADPGEDFDNNQHGVWRLRNSQYNTIYYNPEIEYLPWRGLDRNNGDFTNADPTAAPLDPFDNTNQTIDLTGTHTWFSQRVPLFRNVGTGRKTVANNNIYLPYYWTTTATGRPAWNSPRTLVQIQGPGPLAGGDYPGGISRLDCAQNDGDPLTCTSVEELQNFANWFTYYRTREYSAKAALGRAVADTSNLRMGYAVLNDSNDRVRIDSLNSSFRSGHKSDLIEQIYATNSGGGTPLRLALARAGRHFECLSGDSFGSSGTTTPGSPACPVLPLPEGQCQNNFTMLFSDGTWNGSTSSVASSARQNTDSTASGSGAVNTIFDGGVFADNITGTLADVAMHFYERDLHPGIPDGVPTSGRDTTLAPAGSFLSDDELMHQHMKTYTVGFGVVGNVELTDLPNTGVNPDTGEPVIDFTQPFAWGNPFSSSTAKTDDMLHAALNGRGQFLQANNPVLLAQAFQDAFEEFADGSVSVSAVAFGSTRLRKGTVEYRGFFNLKFNSGDLEAIELLDPDTGLPPATPLVWSAATQIAGTNQNARNIFTFDRLSQSGVPFRHGSLNADQQGMLSSLEVDYLRGDQSLEEPIGPFRARESILGDIVNSGPKAVGRPEGIRRDRVPYPTDALYSSFRTTHNNRRRVVYVGSNDGMLHAFDAGFQEQTPIDNGTGNELFAFVPNKLIDSTQRFNNDLDQLTSLVYSHKFFVDLTPTVEDAFIKPNGSGTQEWRTLLVGGLRGGGKGYFALDITNPDNMAASETASAQSVLWEFTDADDTYPIDLMGVPEGGADGALTDAAGLPVRDLGYTYSEARIAMTNVDGTGSPSRKKWAAIFGNGYNSTSGIAKLFVLFVDDGTNGWQNGDFVKVNTGRGTIASNPSNPALDDPTAGIPNGLGQPTLIDTNLDGVVDVAYAGDLQGNLYRFEIGDDDPTNWQAVKLFTATFDGTTATRQPITTAPTVTKHPDSEGFIISFGTGSFITEQDGLSTDIQSVYGIWDRFEASPATSLPSSKNSLLVEQSITNLVDELGPNRQLRIMTKNAVSYVPGNTGTSNYGWFIDLDPVRASVTNQGNPNSDTGGLAPPNPQYPGERAIRRIVKRANSLVLTSVIPRDANSCFRAPPGAIWFVDALTGGDPGQAIIDSNNDGVIDSNDLITVGGEEYAAGILFDSGAGDGSLVDPSVLLGDGDSDYLVINKSHGEDPQIVRIIKNGNDKTGRLSWWELTNE